MFTSQKEENNSKGFTITISESLPYHALCIMVFINVALVAAYLFTRIFAGIVPLGPFYRFFDLDAEFVIPAWFSSTQLSFVGLAFLLLMSLHHIHKFWFFLTALGFFFLSADEAAQIHENITLYAYRLDISWMTALSIQGHGIWIVLYLAIGCVYLATARNFIVYLWKTYPVSFRWLATGASVFVLGGIGVEIFSYYLPDNAAVLSVLQIAVEEFFEMLGVSLILFASLSIATDRSREQASLSREYADGLGAEPSGRTVLMK
jgi:hypothetical protein